MDAKMRGDFRARMQGIEGANLKRLRLDRRWTQEELAEKLGTHAKYLSPIENGKRGIGNGLMSRLCQVFGVSEAEFRVGAGDEVMSVGKNESLIDKDIAQMINQLPDTMKYDVAKRLREILDLLESGESADAYNKLK